MAHVAATPGSPEIVEVPAQAEPPAQDAAGRPGSADGAADCSAVEWQPSQAKETGITALEATMSLITAIIGAGIMALPQLPRMAGVYPCLIFMVASAFAVSECGGAFFKGWVAWNRVHKNSELLHTFEDFGAAAWGRAGAVLASVTIIGWFIGICSGYVILMAKQLQVITGTDWDYRLFVAILAPELWFLCMLRDLTAVAKLMPLGVAAAVGSCCLLMVSAVRDQQHWEDWPPEEKAQVHSFWPEHGLMALGSVTATLFGAFAVMGNVPAVVSEMKKPKRFPVALKLAMLVVFCLYLGVVMLGYWGYGNFIQDNILVSMSVSPASGAEAFGLPPMGWTGPRAGMLPVLMSTCVFTNLILSYPLNMMSIFVSVQGMSWAKPALAVGTPRNYLMRTGFMLVTVLIAVAVENFGVVYSLFASVCTPLQGVFIPIIFGAIIRQKVGAKGPSAMRWLLHGLIMVLGALCMFIGFLDSAHNLVKEFER